MASINLSPTELVKQDFPQGFFRDVARVIHHHYHSTLKEAQDEYEEPEVNFMWRAARRCKVEAAMRAVATRHKILSRIETNISGDKHTVIDHEHFLLTISHVSTQKEMPRSAQFRQQDAIYNAPLFALFEPPESIEDKKYNIIMIYGPSSMSSWRLGFAMIRFPDPSGTRWLDEAVDLLPYLDDQSDSEGSTVDNVPPPADPQILTDQPQREEI